MGRVSTCALIDISHRVALVSYPHLISCLTDMGATRDFIGLVHHIFLPTKLPQASASEHEEQDTNILMSQATLELAEEYVSHLSTEEGDQWVPIIEMLQQLLRTARIPLSKQTLYRDLHQMKQNSTDLYHLINRC